MATKTKAKKLPTFEVDKAGLAKLLERKGKEFAVAELIQNAWDENVAQVKVTMEWGPGPLTRIEVEDDSPEGFSDIAHAYTLFADSKKKDDPEKRGRFNLGEKLVIAMCEKATITTTKGTVYFDADGRRFSETVKMESGSIFNGFVALTDDERQSIRRLVFKLIPPVGVKTTFNGTELPSRHPRHSFAISLRTERADAEGYLRPTTRKSKVEVFDRQGDEPGMLYELGIPVVETGDTYHVNVGQKVPLNTDRDNVPPSYLRDVRTAVLNEIYSDLDKDSATEQWVSDALEDKSVLPEAVAAVVTHRYGEKVVTADPSDREAEKIAVSQGYTVIPAGAFSKGAWVSVKGTAEVLPAGQVTPSPDPSKGDDLLDYMPEEQWPTYIKQFAEYAAALATEVLSVDGLKVKVATTKKRGDWPFRATWQRNVTKPILTLNFTVLGYPFFEKAMNPEARTLTDDAAALLIHEFAHQRAPEHLSKEFYDACCLFGAKYAAVMASNPDLKDRVIDAVELGMAA